MFRYFYQFCLVVFLLQGVCAPFLLVISGMLWRRQNRRLEALRRELESARGKSFKSSEVSELILEGLPKLKPLNCGNCGGGVLLEETRTLCPYCGTHGTLPEDYVVAVSLKLQTRVLLKSAARHRRVANVLTYAPTTWLFFLMIFVEPLVLFPVVIIGSNLYPDTWFDRAFASLGETAAFSIMASAFFGFVIWMVVYIFLTSLSRSLRSRLPAVPISEEKVAASEAASCQACGGAVVYDAGDFACLCGYCNVENFRVRFARRERTRAESRRTQTKSVLFGAMEILEEFVGTFFFVLLILFGASALLTLFYLFKSM